MNRCLSISIILLFVLMPASAAEGWRDTTENAEPLHRSLKKITDVMVEDIFSPPVASRIYAYVSVAGYETARAGNLEYITLAGQIPHFKPVPQPDAGKVYSFSLASVHAVLTVGKALVFSREKVDVFSEEMLDEFKSSGMPAEVYENSLAYGALVAKHVLAWAA